MPYERGLASDPSGGEEEGSDDDWSFDNPVRQRDASAALLAHFGPYAVCRIALDAEGDTIGRTEGVSALAQPLVVFERLRPRAHERPYLTVQAHAVVQYSGAAAEVVLAEREGEAAPRLDLRRVVEVAADDDRELLGGIAEYWGISMPADEWHEVGWQAAYAFMQERWPQVEALAEALAAAGELDGDSIRALIGLRLPT